MIAAALPDILQRILAVKTREAAELAPRLGELRATARDLPPPRDFRAALSGTELAVIAEIKKASPSAGKIAADLDPAGLAAAYAHGGAAAISVLTDREFFHGGADDLRRARAAVSIPILRKDFIIAEAQVYEARTLGADSLLLIAAALPSKRLADLLGLSRELGMEPLVEIHDEEELAMAVDAGAAIIGVNNRNLRSFIVDLAVAERLRPLFPGNAVSVAESGIRTPVDADRMARAGFDAVLVGEALVRHGAVGCADFLQQLREIRP
jgi:indole-3-glycerol phosphate synthase